MTTENLAFVFPGQGSQKVGMLVDMAVFSPTVQQVFAEASEVLGYDLWALVQDGAQEAINLTERTQPILLSASVALWRVWCEQTELRPQVMAGHSLGEWSALVCAGVIAFADAVKLVQQRGQFMQAAVPVGEGAMAAVIGLDDDIIKQICRDSADGEIVAPVNFNSPNQVVIAGNVAAVNRAIERCQQAKAKRALLLPVSAPFHTELMRPAAQQLGEQIFATQFHSPDIPVIHNTHAQSENDSERIKHIMIEQIYSPVLWVDCVNTMMSRGADTLLECGPGKVLSGLNKRISRGVKTFAVETPDELKNAITELQ